ncbi:hypothetical protein Pmani_039332 [Petrolisthes manimaculis]|uniref:receptor protein-tyrosine kinase n=1 Tax=Petrolisthes manimaculis TaxID=1843537 RepID=A0AAE1TJK5_9EUCA|nr:hypothetical protein Pmani_039332 [Petrolisthes manimaculis]
MLPPVPGKIDKPVGHNVKLKCQVTGKPEPTVTWFKDGLELREGSLGGDSRLTRHYLHLYDLRPQDAGTYTCAAANPLGAAAANWTIRVIDQAQPREPEFNPQEPANTTVVSGESATLQCSGSSEVNPHIKWLRRIEEGSREADNIPDNQTLNWKGHRYVVLQATQVLTPGDGSFYTKLVLPRVRVQDTGVYVCTATNNFGLAYRQALLSVMEKPADSNTLLLIIVVACVAGVILLAVVVLMVRRNQSTKPPPPPSSNESALLPPPPLNQSKIQPPPPHHHPRCYAPGQQHPQQQPQQPPPPQQVTAPHGHSVGPEGPLLPYAGGVVHLPPQAAMGGSGQPAQPIMVFHDPSSAASVYIAQRPTPTAQAASQGRPEYQYQHLDVI